MVSCLFCSKQFESKNSNQYGSKKFCSKKCNERWHSHQAYLRLGKVANNELQKKYRAIRNGKKLSENKSKKREVAFPSGVDYEKPFLDIKDGYGHLGVLLVDKKTGEVQCHICGGYYHWLANHIWGTHKIKPNIYKEQFGLGQNTALASEKVREQLVRRAMTFPWERLQKGRQRLLKAQREGKTYNRNHRNHGMATAEEMNKNGTCQLQVLDKLINISEKLGRQPYAHEMIHKDGANFRQTIRNRYGSVAEVRRLLEMQGYRYQKPDTKLYSDDELLTALKQFTSVYKRRPVASDIKRGLLPSEGVFTKRFGSWKEAKLLAFGKPELLQTQEGKIEGTKPRKKHFLKEFEGKEGSSE